MKVIKLTKDTFKNTVDSAGKPVLIDFFATWCGPCMMVSPIIDEIAEETEKALVCKVDVDEEPELANLFGVDRIPTLIVIRDGKVHAKEEGLRTKEQILQLIS